VIETYIEKALGDSNHEHSSANLSSNYNHNRKTPPKTRGGAETDEKYELVLPINRARHKRFQSLGKQQPRALQAVTTYTANCSSFPAGTSEASCFLLNNQRYPINFSNQGTPVIFVSS